MRLLTIVSDVPRGTLAFMGTYSNLKPSMNNSIPELAGGKRENIAHGTCYDIKGLEKLLLNKGNSGTKDVVNLGHYVYYNIGYLRQDRCTKRTLIVYV